MNISFTAEKLLASNFTNSLLTSVVATLVILLLAFLAVRSIRPVPGKHQNIAEWIVEMLMGLTEGITGSREKAMKILPLGATFFIFILVNNWLGLFPGVGSIGFHETVHGKELFIPLLRAGNADLNTTLALALVSVGATQYYGVSTLRLSYFKKFINFSNPINAFVGVLETISEFAKVISFSFRLFGNVFAGEVLLSVITGLLPFIAPLPFYGLEIFVGLVQALVFAMLSMVFFHVAMQRH